MSPYDQNWVDALVAEVAAAAPLPGLTLPLRLLYLITDTADGKQAFHLDFVDGQLRAGTAGKPPRGESADVTITIREDVALALWTGARSRDAAFMAGDLKVEGSYEQWLDQLVPAFETPPWSTAWAASV